MRAMLSVCGGSNSTRVLTNYQEVVAIFLELVAATEWLELPETDGRIAEKAARMIVPAGATAL
jgi:hypothetical protein